MGNISAALSKKKSEANKKLEKDLLLCKNQLIEEKKRTEELKNIINKFNENYKDYDNEMQSERKINRQKLMVELSKLKIKSFVDDLLKDKQINIEYLPDFVEKQIYYNVITIIMGIAEHSLSTFKVEFLGHEIDILLHPVNNSLPATEALCEDIKNSVLDKVDNMK